MLLKFILKIFNKTFYVGFGNLMYILSVHCTTTVTFQNHVIFYKEHFILQLFHFVFSLRDESSKYIDDIIQV